MSKTFDDIADAQGWNADSRELVMKDFIDTHPGGGDLVAYAQSRADEENGVSTLPAFSKDVRGQYFGGAFWDDDDYRVRIEALDGTGEKFLLTVETSDGTVIGQSEMSHEEADGVQKMGTTMHDIDVYEDDWKFPPGMSRVLTWTLPTDEDHTVVLNEGDITEIAAWFDYAIGEKVWDGGEVWEF